ncbi:hypothetical protein SK128_002803, partial [Halocaridina rubra]
QKSSQKIITMMTLIMMMMTQSNNGDGDGDYDDSFYYYIYDYNYNYEDNDIDDDDDDGGNGEYNNAIILSANSKPQSHEATLLIATAGAATSSRLVAKLDWLGVISKSNWQLKILTATKVKHPQLCLPVAHDFMIK